MGMQAAGAIADIAGTKKQIKQGKAGTALELAQIENRLEQERAASAQSSLDAMISLRSNLATQQAIFASRGTRGTAGTAASLASASVRNFSSDERTRRMNLLSREADLRATKTLTGMHQLSSETQLGQALGKRLIDQLPISEGLTALRGKFNA
jgi:hypothetical protein